MNLKLRFKVFVKYLDGSTKTLRPSKKTQISHSNVLENLESAYLKVSYRKGLQNEGIYYSKRELLNALNAWTEDQLLKYIKDGEWE